MDALFNKALVTGGAGFIGSHLVDALVAAKCDVTVLDNLSTGHLSNLSHLKNQITFIEADIRDSVSVMKASAGCDVIFHEAAVVSVPQTVREPVVSAMVNDIGTLTVLEAARKHNVKRTILASSCAVYGDNPGLPKVEIMPAKPMSPYAVQKRTGELNARLYHELYGVETVCLRYFNVYGPRQDPSSPYSGVISVFLTRATEKRKPVIYGDGAQSRDFVFVKDVVRANLLSACAKGASGTCFNVGTGRSIQVNQLWDSISRLSGIRIDAEHVAQRPGDIRDSLADISLAGEVLGFSPEYEFEKGLELTFEWYKNGELGV
jgi:nucleoside-diphosphate-sugar epimerase